MNKSLLIAALAAVSLVACGNDESEQSGPTTGAVPTLPAESNTATTSSSPGADSSAAAGTAATPPTGSDDPSVPETPSPAAGSSGAAPTPPGTASPSAVDELTPAEESRAMPQAGQVHDYSFPERNAAEVGAQQQDADSKKK